MPSSLKLSPPATATKRAGQNIMFPHGSIPLLLVALLLIWLLDLPEIRARRWAAWCLTAIVATVKLIAFLIRYSLRRQPQP